MGTELWNIVDVEATCWRGSPPPGSANEIIEIGLSVVDAATGERVSRHGLLVRPGRSEVSPFCTELTGITPEMVEGAVDFAEACRWLVAEHRSAERPWASWGDYDRRQFERQCAMTGVGYPFGGRHVNAKRVFGEAYGMRKRPPGMARALDAAGLPLEGRHHRGEDDAWNIAALVAHLVDRGVWPGAEAADAGDPVPTA
ncbi:exonuclease domain-containing protein [Nocardiopsis changdeensis]|uniref:Exonuclease domain-containing protein n=1 Tax=Nocardiopsis changdeensis TaxID=2831969 RepID=A0ABX8BPK0_9ACTN|nr:MULTISPECIES: 3'-5' exonuclease [Nocardiopsis]QUX23650.1 exonuclease domain-containing protein [Nocardiopsis changdeensis]QYX39593.1 exonuclease domain-containing protein [Nocardiopsis sp. MT53]